ncbi:molybdopterin-containing oxidoreductase family protein [Gordonia sp. DT30]|uniref:molybdopterin-containing oxidoreductase family protein n=1 Tax=Gordonia sp. DT30 TaxID=3416546 RepID=UPI003CF76B3C
MTTRSGDPTASRRTSYCRLCPSSCGVLLDIENNRIERVLGDAAHPISRGYTCAKGRRGGDFTHDPERLRTSLRRNEGGEFVPVDVDVAVPETASRLRSIIGDHGPDSVALFTGTQNNFAALTGPMARAWFRGTGSHKLFSTMTIDQSAKWVVQDRMGKYLGGRQRVENSDVWLLAGTNPLVSVNGGDGDGAVVHNPSVTLRDAKARGMTLIVIDPRRTETAARADIHLAPRPGTDAVLLAGLIRLILGEGLHDRGFCERYTSDLPELVEAVSPATPTAVEEISRVPQALMVSAARAFATAARGMATTGTGVCMGPHSNVSEHLVAVLNTICGRYLREGETADVRSVLARSVAPRAEVAGADREWETGFKSRIGGIGRMRGELPSAILADEILNPGPDRVRALIVSGGNPAAALPDKARAAKALDALDLLVVVDSWMSGTAQRADYVIAPTTMYERADHTILMEAFFPIPFAQHTEPVVIPPPGVIEDWQFFDTLAVASGQSVKFAGRILDPQHPPTSRELLEMFAERGRVPFDELTSAEHGCIADGTGYVVQPATTEGSAVRLGLCPADVRLEIERALTSAVGSQARSPFPMRLIVRRIKEAMNSHGTMLPNLIPEHANAAKMSTTDMDSLGIHNGQVVAIRSASGRMQCAVHADTSLPPGVVSVTHGFDDQNSLSVVRVSDTNVNALTWIFRAEARKMVC